LRTNFLRGGFSFSDWTGAWDRIYAYKCSITKLGACLVDTYAGQMKCICSRNWETSVHVCVAGGGEGSADVCGGVWFLVFFYT